MRNIDLVSRRFLRSTPLLVVLLTALVFSAPTFAKSYGEGLQLEAPTPIADIVADPEAFAGERVRVEGTVTDVCPRKGCWMSLRNGDAAVRIKVEDDVIVFPQEAKDHAARAEGVVEVLDLDRDQYTSWMAHLADERGETFDPSTVGDGPYRLIQIRGEGAEIDLAE